MTYIEPDVTKAVRGLGPLLTTMNGRAVPEWKRKALAWEIQGVVERARAAGIPVRAEFARVADGVTPESGR